MTDDEFAGLYTALHIVIYKFAARRVGSERAKDITSETFAVAWEKRHEYPADKDAWIPWTVGIARNKVLQDIQNRGRKHHDNRFVTDWLSTGTEPAVEDSSRIVIDSVRSRAIFGHLTPAEQDLFGIAFIRDLSPADGAAVLSISVTAYTTRVARLRQRLRTLEQEHDDAPDTARSTRP